MRIDGTHLRATASLSFSFSFTLTLAFPGVGGSPTRRLFAFGLLLRVLSYLDHTFVMALHAVDALAGLCKDKLVDAILADLALETVCMV